MPIQFHPELTTPESAKEDYTQVRSDHVPILVTIPGTGNEAIKIVSWNVLQEDSASGFGQPEMSGRSFGETDQQRTARHLRIACTLKASIDNNTDVDFIALQEIDVRGGQDFLDEILKQLGGDWDCVKTQGNEIANKYSNITLYRKTKFQPANDTSTDIKALQADLTKFHPIGNPTTTIEILNVHVPFKCNPEPNETLISNFLARGDKSTKSIVVGDFNCTFAPLDDSLKNIVTSVSPPGFRQEMRQGAFAIDGCFYSTYIGNKRIYKQAEIAHLNSTQGTKYPVTGFPPDYKDYFSNLDNRLLLDKFALNELYAFRPIMAIDNIYQHKKIFKKQTIFEYQKKLRKEFQFEGVVVRPSKAIDNKTGITVSFNHDINDQNTDNQLVYHFLNLLNGETFQYSFVKNEFSEEKVHTISVSSADAPHLTQAMNLAVALKNMTTKLNSEAAAGRCTADQQNILIDNTKTMLRVITDLDKSKDEKLAAITTYENQQKEILSTPIWKIFCKLIAAVIITAVCTVLGFVGGALLGTFIGAPAGPGAIVSATVSALAGGKSGLTLGLGIATGIVSGGITGILCKKGFFKSDPVVKAAKEFVSNESASRNNRPK